jgi:hypothetical protein
MADEAEKTVKLTVLEAHGKSATQTVSVNGDTRTFEVGKEYEVPEGYAEVLANSNVKFSTDDSEAPKSVELGEKGAGTDFGNQHPLTDGDAMKAPAPELVADGEQGGQVSGNTVEGDMSIKTETVPQLKERVAGVEDRATLEQELADEKAGANRATAITAIEAKLAALPTE